MKKCKISISILIVFSLVFGSCNYSFAASSCNTSGSRCSKFSWDNCTGAFSYNGGSHTKYVYCNSCGCIVLIQSGYGSCVNSSSMSYSSNGNGTHQTIITCCCNGDINDGYRWGGCGHSDSTSIKAACTYTTKTTSTQKITYCSLCGYVKSTENLSATQQEEIKEDSSLQGSGYISTYTNGLYVSGSYAIEMWHYSGGYWNIGDYRGNRDKVYDSTVGSLLNVSRYLNNNYGSLVFNVSLPSKVSEAVKAGKSGNVTVSASGGNGLSILGTTLQSNSLLVVANCNYNLSSYSMSDYVSGLNKDIPLVPSAYGYNLYSIYKNGSNQGAGTGLFASSSTISSPYIHPKMISNSKGQLKSGYSALINGVSKSSDGYYVGWNTFSNAGAVGLEFDFPFYISFSIREDEVEKTKADTKQDGNTESGQEGNTGGNQDSGSSGSGTTEYEKPTRNDPVTPPSKPIPTDPPGQEPDNPDDHDEDDPEETKPDKPDNPGDDSEAESTGASIHRKY